MSSLTVDSTMAQALAETLDNVFNLNSEVDTLSHKIHQKKQTITIQNWELEALHARIREAEERLKMQQSLATRSRANTRNDSHGSSPHTNNLAFDQDDSVSSPVSDGCSSEGGLTDASTAPSTTYTEDRHTDEDVDDVDRRTIRDVDRKQANSTETQTHR
ncbi:hypothetical protein LOZ66_004286 [Ophidiomyces ophidiicola]|nr:hypothetical protein LOZ66_004286 [Ophidiomyces ophidiicola]